jgi:hypothetical protein
MMMPGGVVPSPSAYYPRSGYPYSASPGYGHPGPLAIIERPGLPTRRSEMSARTARPGGRQPIELVQYNPNAGGTLSARRPMKPIFQEPSVESEEDEEEDFDEDEEDSDEFSEEEDEIEDEEEEGEEDEDLDPIAVLQRKLDAVSGTINNTNMGSRNMDDTQMRAEAARRQAEQRRQQQRQMPPPNVPASVAAAAAAAANASGPPLSMRKTMGPAPHISYPNRRPSEHNVDEDLRASIRALTMEQTSGNSSTRRPSLASSGATKNSTYSHPTSTGNARITIEAANRNRRNSYIGSEDRAKLEAMHARFQSQPEDPRLRHVQQPQRGAPPPDFTRIIEKVVRDKLNELHLPPQQGAHSKMDINSQMMAALAYQSRSDQAAPRTRDELGDLPQIPLTASALRHKSGQPSHTGSSRSKRSSDDGSRISASRRLTTGSESGAMTVNGDEMKVRVDTLNGFEMDIEGRRIMLQPTGDGTAVDLIIGGKRESSYFSVKGSTATRSQVGSRVTRAASQREPRERDHRERDPPRRERDAQDRDAREREREQRDRERERRDRRDRDRARYEDDDEDEEEDRRTVRGGGGRRRAETYDSEYARTGQMRRQDRYPLQNDYPPTPSYTQPQPYRGPAVSSAYNGYPPQPYPASYSNGNPGDHVWGA